MTVVFYGNIQERTFGEKSTEINPAKGLGGKISLRKLIDLLGERYGVDFRTFLLGDDTCFFLVNGGGVMTTGGLDTPLRKGDTVEVLPFVDAG